MCQILSAAPLTLISAIRYDVGTDYFYTYAPGFEQILYQYGDRGMQFEIGFRLLNQLICLFTADYAWLFAITSILFGALTCRNIYRQSQNPLFSVFFYVTMSVFFASMNMVRQAIAIAVAYAAMPLIERKKWFRYVLWIALAAAFHFSALIFLPCGWLLSRKWTPKAAVVAALTGIALAGLISAAVRLALPYMGGGGYARYLGQAEVPSTWSLMIAFVLFALAVGIKTEDSHALCVLSANLVVGVLTWYIPFMARVTAIFTYGVMLYFPSVLNGIHSANARRCIKAAGVLCFIVYMFFTVVVRGGHDVLPYQTIFAR